MGPHSRVAMLGAQTWGARATRSSGSDPCHPRPFAKFFSAVVVVFLSFFFLVFQVEDFN